MYPNQPAPAPAAGEPPRPSSITRGAVFIGVACVGVLVETAACVLLMTWQPADGSNRGIEEEGFAPALFVYIAWGLISVALLMLGAVLALRGTAGGRVLVWIVGAISLITLFGCAGISGIVQFAGAEENWDGYPPQWMFMLGAIGSVLGAVAIIVAMFSFGQRASTLYLKPRMYGTYAVPPQYPGTY